MARPRQIVPGRFYTVTRRCVERLFLLRPDEMTNNNYLYCLLLAAQRCAIEIIATCAVSNHHHTTLLDRYGNLPTFMQYFHLLLARSQNCYRRRWEHFWASGGPSAVELVTPDDVRRAVIYTVTNPVKDLLVETVAHWPGVNSWGALRRGEALVATRPRHFFRQRMPARVELALHVPEGFGLGTREEFVAAVGLGVAAAEQQARRTCAESGRKVLGRRAILRQSPFASPTSAAPRRALSPRVKCSNKWHRIEALTRNRAFVEAHRTARLAWLAGLPHDFPVGTWALRHLVSPDARVVPPDRAHLLAALVF